MPRKGFRTLPDDQEIGNQDRLRTELKRCTHEGELETEKSYWELVGSSK